MNAIGDLASATLVEVLAATGIGKAKATSTKPGLKRTPGGSPEERNVAFLPLTSVRPLQWGSIEPDPRVAPPRARVLVVAGPGATILGVGTVLAGMLAGVSPAATPPLDAPMLARAVLAMNPDLSVGGGDWRTGRVLQLPIEAAGEQWETDPDTMRALAEGLPQAAAAMLSRPATALPRPDPVATRREIGDGSGHGSAPAAAALLRNPSEELWRLLRTLEVVADKSAFAAGVAAALGDRQLASVTATTAGAAAVRALWRVAAEAAAGGDVALAAVRDRLATALGLATATTDPLTIGPTTAHAEPPLTTRQQGNGRGTAHGHVLGIDVAVASARYHYPQQKRTPPADKLHPSDWSGWAVRGDVDPGAWIADRTATPGPGSLVGDPPDARLAARLEICRRIAPNEGELDAANVYDAGIVSTGMQQWTARADDEMLALLAWLARSSATDYDVCFGIHGLATTVSATFAGGEPRAAAPSRVDAGMGPLALPPASMTDPRGPRLDFFGPAQFSEQPAGGHRFAMPPTWGWRVRLAAWASWAHRDAEALWAAFRFSRISLDLPDTAPFPVTPGHTFTLAQLFNSKYGAALVLDQHVNQPGKVRADIRKAITRAKAAVTPAVDASGSLNPSWLDRLWSEYRACRRVDPSTKARRDTTIDSAFPAGADRQPGTFTAW